MVRKVKTPTTVHTTNCRRSGATTPPLVMKSARLGCTSPAPLEPLLLVMPVASTLVPALASRIPGKFPGISGNTALPWTTLRATEKKT